MILTHNWMFIHLPRTAGTWAVDILRNACKMEQRQYLDVPGHLGRDVAVPIVDVPVITTRRHPCDWYVSLYELRHWVDFQRLGSPMGTDSAELLKLSFPEWLRYAIDGRDHSHIFSASAIELPPGVGWATANWRALLGTLPAKEQWDIPLGELFHGVYFVRYEHLREDLTAWMTRQGFGPVACGLPSAVRPINTAGPRNHRQWEGYYGPEELEMVYTKDATLFEAWPEYAPA